MDLHKGLAEKLLIELNMRVQRGGIIDTELFRKDVFLLITVSGISQEITDIETMLQPFKVGTDK